MFAERNKIKRNSYISKNVTLRVNSMRQCREQRLSTYVAQIFIAVSPRLAVRTRCGT